MSALVTNVCHNTVPTAFFIYCRNAKSVFIHRTNNIVKTFGNYTRSDKTAVRKNKVFYKAAYPDNYISNDIRNDDIVFFSVFSYLAVGRQYIIFFGF